MHIFLCYKVVYKYYSTVLVLFDIGKYSVVGLQKFCTTIGESEEKLKHIIEKNKNNNK